MQKLVKTKSLTSKKDSIDKDLIVETDRRWVAPDRRHFDALDQVQTSEDIRTASPLQLIRSMMNPTTTSTQIKALAEEVSMKYLCMI